MRALNRPLAGSPGSALGWSGSTTDNTTGSVSGRALAWGRSYVMVRPDHFRVDYVINPYMDPADHPKLAFNKAIADCWTTTRENQTR